MISVLLAAQAQAGCVCWHFWCEAQQYPLSPLLLSYFPAVSCLPSQRKEHPLHFHFFSLPIPSRETRLNCAHPLCWVWWAPLLWDVSAGEGSWKGRYCVKGGTSPRSGRCCPHWECMHKHMCMQLQRVHQSPTETGGGILKSVSSFHRYHAQAMLSGENFYNNKIILSWINVINDWHFSDMKSDVGIQISESVSGCIQGHQRRTLTSLYVVHTIQ